MDRSRRIRSNILITIYLISSLLIIQGCQDKSDNPENMSQIDFKFSIGYPISKGYMPDEEKITDINLVIFDSHGSLEKAIYIESNDNTISTNLLKGARYSIFACVNFGYKLPIDDINDIDELSFHLAYPDEFKGGIPMCAEVRDFLISNDDEIVMNLKRLVSKISIRMDRSKLSDDIDIKVNSLRIGNCPRYTFVFSPNSVTDDSDCFRIGFRHEDQECEELNSQHINGMSGYISVFMFENLQGQFTEDDNMTQTCSYIEIEMDYISSTLASVEKPLIYRFLLGENQHSRDIHRNCHYRITICPEDDGLNDDGWRVDKSGLEYIGPTSLEQYPSDYIVGDIGDTIHIGCILTPENTPFDVGEEYMQDDKKEGIYDYVIDPDGHGATLTLKGPGRGMIYMKADEPIQESALFIIEVNQPE